MLTPFLLNPGSEWFIKNVMQVMAVVLGRMLRAALPILLLNFIALAQGREKLYELKSDLTSVLLVHDPKCPLQLIDPSPVFGYENGAVVAEYTVQNISRTNVISWEQHQINWLNNERRTERPEVLQDRWVFEPLTTYSSFSPSGSFDLVEPDKKTAEKLGFSNWRNRILILMVVKVKLADGTTYDASRQLIELTTFLDGFDGDSTKEEMESQLQRVRDFVATLFSKPTPEQRAADK